MELTTQQTARRRAVAASLAVALAVVTVVIGGTWLVRGGTLLAAASDGPDANDDRPGSEPAWQVLPGTFPVSRAWLSGPYLLAPDSSGCLVGFGWINTGTAMTAGYWRSTEDCTSVVDITPAHQPIGDALPSHHRGLVVAAAPASGGGYLAVKRLTFEGDLFAYQSDIIHVDPYQPDQPALVRQLAEFRADDPRSSHIGPAALVTVGTGYAAVGRDNDAAVAWTSPDGASWHQVVLPDAGLGTAPSVAALAAGPDGLLVAVGTGGTSAASELVAGWVSTDGGARWSQAQMPETAGRPSLTSLVHTGREFVALGREGDPVSGGWPTALVLTSPDGVEWTRDDSLAAAGSFSVSAVAALPGGGLIAISDDYAASDRQGSSRADQRCATAWVQDAGGWIEESLGCHGVPTNLTVLPDGSVAGVHWSTLFLRPTD